jgi:hypothetical protein
MRKRRFHGVCLSLWLAWAPVALGAENKPFQQDAGADGLVSMEAEHYDNKVDTTNNSWALVTTATAFAGEFSGGQAMQIMPDTALGGRSQDTGFVTAAPHLDFQINFVKTGTYYVWLLAFGQDGNSDSAHAGLDGKFIDSADGNTRQRGGIVCLYRLR